MADLVPNRYSKALLPYWLQPSTVEKAKNRIAMAIKAAPALPYTVEKASATRAVETASEITSPVSRLTSPLERTANAVRLHTMMVSANTSKIPHIP